MEIRQNSFFIGALFVFCFSSSICVDPIKQSDHAEDAVLSNRLNDEESAKLSISKSSQSGTSDSSPWGTSMSTTKKVAIGVGAAAVGAGAVVLAPVALAATGFGATGVAAGSIAAAWQSTIGLVAGGSVFASLQSAGAAGLAFGTQAIIGATGAAAGAGIGVGISAAASESGPSEDKSKDKFEDNSNTIKTNFADLTDWSGMSEGEANENPLPETSDDNQQGSENEIQDGM